MGYGSLTSTPEFTLLAEFLGEFRTRYEPVHVDQYDTRRVRWPSFLFIATHLIHLHRAVHIVECGTAQYGKWQEVGNSTLLWDWLVQRLGGTCDSIDHDARGVERVQAQTKEVTYHVGEAVHTLSLLPAQLRICDLLYLDMDWTMVTNVVSATDHLGALAVAYHEMPKGSLVGVDDCYDDRHGKHFLLERFLAAMHAPKVFAGFTSVWQKA